MARARVVSWLRDRRTRLPDFWSVALESGRKLPLQWRGRTGITPVSVAPARHINCGVQPTWSARDLQLSSRDFIKSKKPFHREGRKGSPRQANNGGSFAFLASLAVLVDRSERLLLVALRFDEALEKCGASLAIVVAARPVLFSTSGINVIERGDLAGQCVCTLWRAGQDARRRASSHKEA